MALFGDIWYLPACLIRVRVLGDCDWRFLSCLRERPGSRPFASFLPAYCLAHICCHLVSVSERLLPPVFEGISSVTGEEEKKITKEKQKQFSSAFGFIGVNGGHQLGVAQGLVLQRRACRGRDGACSVVQVSLLPFVSLSSSSSNSSSVWLSLSLSLSLALLPCPLKTRGFWAPRSCYEFIIVYGEENEVTTSGRRRGILRLL